MLAVGPGALGHLAQAITTDTATPNTRLVDYLPWLSEARQARAEPIAVFNVYFKRKLEGIPAEHTSLPHSDMGLSFLDLSQLWTDLKPKPGNEGVTVLVVAASNYYGLPSDLNSPGGIKDNLSAMLVELRRFVPALKEVNFQKDVNWIDSHFISNIGTELYVNSVHSESWRAHSSHFPDALPNFFLAGGARSTDVGMATVEAAVTTGIEVAKAVNEVYRLKPPVVVKEHKNFSDTQVNAMKLLVMPSAYAAKYVSGVSDLVGTSGLKKTPGETVRDAVSLGTLPLKFGLDFLETSATTGVSFWRDYLGGR